MKTLTFLPFFLSVLLWIGGTGFSQPTAAEAASSPQALEEYLASLEGLSDADAAQALSDLIAVIEDSGMPDTDKTTMIAGVVNQAYTQIPLDRQSSFTTELLNRTSDSTKVVVVSTLALTRPTVLREPAVEDAVNGDEALAQAAENTPDALGDAYDLVVEFLRDQGSLDENVVASFEEGGEEPQVRDPIDEGGSSVPSPPPPVPDSYDGQA